MAENKLKWYNILAVLFGTILSFADPVTDILTLVEFYRANHKMWFGVGLVFIILPSLLFLFANLVFEEDRGQCTVWKYTRFFVLGCNPLLPGWLKLQTLFLYLKKLLNRRKVGNTDQTVETDLDHLLKASKFAVLIEAALESAPQFIIQLYAMAVQQEAASIVQMVSLPVSFLSLAWASVVVDEWIHSDEGDINFSVKDRVLLFVTHLFILSSRFFAVALFTVSYKWWVSSVLIFHSTIMTICDTTIWLCSQRSFACEDLFLTVLISCFHWLRDDLSMIIGDDEPEHSQIKHFERMRLVSNVLFVIENFIMILLFYFSHFPHTWYSLPVTIYVCLFAVFGAVMRLAHFYSFKMKIDSGTKVGILWELDLLESKVA